MTKVEPWSRQTWRVPFDSLTPTTAAFQDQFQYLHFSVSPKCGRLNKGRISTQQSSVFVLQKETVPLHQSTWSARSWTCWNLKHFQAQACCYCFEKPIPIFVLKMPTNKCCCKWSICKRLWRNDINKSYSNSFCILSPQGFSSWEQQSKSYLQ